MEQAPPPQRTAAATGSDADGESVRQDRSTAQNCAIVALLVLLVEITGLTYTMVTPALSEIAAAYRSPDISWIVTAVTLVGAIAFAVCGKLGDIYGKKAIALVCTAVFAVGTALCATAPVLPLLIAGRALQGFGLAVLSLAYGLVRDVLPKRLIPIALGFIGTGMGASAIIGPVISGLLVEPFTFRGIFWFQFGYAIVVGLLVWRFVPESGLRARAGVDWIGASLLGFGALAFLFGVGTIKSAGWLSVPVLGGIGAGVLLIAGWFRYERRAADPLVRIDLLAQRRVGLPLLANACVQFALVGNSMLVPMFVMSAPEGGFGFGATALEVAGFLAASGVSAMVAGPVSGLISRRFGPRAGMTFGASALVTGAALIAFVHDTATAVLLAQLVFGIGIGSASAALPNVLVHAVPADVQGVSGGMLNLVGSFGSSIGSQVLIVLLLLPGAHYTETGFVLAFLATAACGAIALTSALLVGPLRDRE
ncbi:Major Facilitator Superfamily protein [Saccharopolyspora antimicrobica]|uniref:MFS transporter n=1 Tax=Saccharopolyspora antimicrobica TaxID=455193 RepID=A0A1I5JXI6_9PSEU|nr:MFS transporter [Saccharopolyspora antimicrobica]RKT86990.1 MFS transporter [Saccharopolyspora antimicrobica]SFO77488.1 Major Facilitator Superfamily protein [Saccharopolyspora antimicrobica]